ncbi:MAG: ABC transporter substrate-binding protein [Clostridia bacterium]|nr:ABC transporter substrate-binding protein [Clostridia bacterium]
MKKILYIVLALILSIVAVAAGFAEENEGHLEVSTFWITPDLNFANGYNGWVCTRIGIGETLIRLNDDVQLEPCVADSWEQVDELTWKLHIREGVSFHNGKPVDAAAAMASIQYAYDNNSRAVSYLDLKEMSADGQELTIVTNNPNAAVIFNLTEPLFCIFDVSSENLDDMPQGTGPYMVTGFDEDVRVYLSKNESYWDGEVGLDTITVTEIADSEARSMALQSGETEMTVTLDNASLILFDNENYNVSVAIGERTNTVFMNNERPFTGELALRQAISWAVDRETYAATITGGEAATGLFPSSLPYHNDELTAYTYDPDRANQILDRAGFVDTDGDGIREINGENIHLEFYMAASHGSSDGMLLAQAIQADLRNIGVEVELLMAENLSDIIASGNFDMSTDNSNTAPTGDAQYFLSIRYGATYGGSGSDHSGNTGRYHSEEMEALLERMNSTFDVEQRYYLARDAAQILLDDAAALYLTYVPMNTVSASYVKNAEQPTVDYYMITKDLTIEK